MECLNIVPSAFPICNLDVSALAKKLENDALFGKYDWRKKKYVHEDMSDIWVRYNDPSLRDTPDFNEEHDSQWYPIIDDIPEVLRICLDLMAEMGGERLGGVLITKLPPGGKIKRHVDESWHSRYYDKFFVPIKNEKGALFCWDDITLEPKAGEVWQFDNSVPHWVENNSNSDRIAMIVCIKTVAGALHERR